LSYDVYNIACLCEKICVLSKIFKIIFVFMHFYIFTAYVTVKASKMKNNLQSIICDTTRVPHGFKFKTTLWKFQLTLIGFSFSNVLDDDGDKIMTYYYNKRQYKNIFRFLCINRKKKHFDQLIIFYLSLSVLRQLLRFVYWLFFVGIETL